MGKFKLISRYITYISSHQEESTFIWDLYCNRWLELLTANTNAARFLNSMLANFTLDTVESLGRQIQQCFKKKLFKCLHLRIQISCAWHYDTMTCCHSWLKECQDTIWWWNCCKVPRCEVIIPCHDDGIKTPSPDVMTPCVIIHYCVMMSWMLSVA